MYKVSGRSGKHVKFEILQVVSGEQAFFQIIETWVSNFLFTDDDDSQWWTKTMTLLFYKDNIVL